MRRVGVVPAGGSLWFSRPMVPDCTAAVDQTGGREPMERLTADRQLMAYRHEGFWQMMDTLQERNLLEELWRSGKRPCVTSVPPPSRRTARLLSLAEWGW